MRSHYRRTRPGVPAKWDHGRRQSDSDRIPFSNSDGIVFSDRDSDSDAYSQWYPFFHSNAKWHDQSHSDSNGQRQSFGDSKCDGNPFGDSKRNSKCYRQSFWHPECYSECHGKS